jgi:hypothetical protein
MSSIFTFADNVLGQLAGSVSVGATSITVGSSAGVNNPPPDPDGGIACLTLVDNLQNPTKLETIYYTGRTGSGPYTLTGVIKGREDTPDESWSVGDYFYQALTTNTRFGPLLHPKTIDQDLHVPDNYNAALVGPVGPGAGKTFSVGADATLVVLGDLNE